MSPNNRSDIATTNGNKIMIIMRPSYAGDMSTVTGITFEFGKFTLQIHIDTSLRKVSPIFTLAGKSNNFTRPKSSAVAKTPLSFVKSVELTSVMSEYAGHIPSHTNPKTPVQVNQFIFSISVVLMEVILVPRGAS